MSSLPTWLGIAFCLSQSALFSGLNLAVFSVSRLDLEAAAAERDRRAVRVLALRKDAHFTLTTILWGNVAINVLLTLLAESVLTGIGTFLFSTIGITILGEIVPQAYFTRNALRLASFLSPVLRFYRCLLFPLAWPSARMLDLWVGQEDIPWMRERDLRRMLRHHARSPESEISQVEAAGAINFLLLDDLPISREGEPLDPLSVIAIPFAHGQPSFPSISRDPADPFLRQVAASRRKWVVFTSQDGQPHLVASAPKLISSALFSEGQYEPASLCHHPLVVKDPKLPLGTALQLLTVQPERPGDDVIDHDLILLWTPENRRIITGSDILGRLLRSIARPT